MVVRRLSGTNVRGALAIVVGVLILGGCGGGDDDLTLEEQLGKLAGRPLSVAEVDDQLALADTMCSFDTKVLTEIWTRLDARQLEFQDFVFGQHCPDRLSVYETARLTTGAVPEEAPEGGIDDPPGLDPDDPSPSDLLESITSDDRPDNKRGTSTSSGSTTTSTVPNTTSTTPASSTTRRSTTSG